MNAVHPIKITESDYHSYRDQYFGICVGCQEIAECCEPDARRYRCDACGTNKVYGIEELLIAGLLEFTDPEASQVKV